MPLTTHGGVGLFCWVVQHILIHCHIIFLFSYPKLILKNCLLYCTKSYSHSHAWRQLQIFCQCSIARLFVLRRSTHLAHAITHCHEFSHTGEMLVLTMTDQSYWHSWRLTLRILINVARLSSVPDWRDN